VDGFVDALVSGEDSDPVRMYYNYADPTLEKADAHEYYWREHYEQLLSIKSEWDPRRVFENPQAVGS